MTIGKESFALKKEKNPAYNADFGVNKAFFLSSPPLGLLTLHRKLAGKR